MLYKVVWIYPEDKTDTANVSDRELARLILCFRKAIGIEVE